MVQTHTRCPFRLALCAGAVAVIAATLATTSAAAQQTELTLSEARAQARRASPGLAAARAALDVAAARERQARAYSNPLLTYSREQTSANAQDIAALEQRIEIGGQRGARTAAARLRREAAASRLAAAEAALDFEVARRFATALAARRRAELSAAAAEQFRQAVLVVEERLAGGDVSGYEARRIRLEAARYAALSAEGSLAERTALANLQEILAADALPTARLAPLAPVEADELALAPDSVVVLAITRSPELRAAAQEAEAALADARLAARERIPTPALTAGYKREDVEEQSAVGGFVAGVSLPLPLWDRRSGAVEAAGAEARRVAAELNGTRLRIAREARATLEAVRRADEQTAALATALGDEASAAMRAAEAAYVEGETTLVEWLDAVRAYQEAEAAYAVILAESFIQRAALERLLGAALVR